MNYSFISPALSELDEAAYYYEKQVEGLGGEFLRGVDSAIDRICSFPEAWGKIQSITDIAYYSAFHTPSFTHSSSQIRLSSIRFFTKAVSLLLGNLIYKFPKTCKHHDLLGISPH
jgi:hypothetical protein